MKAERAEALVTEGGVISVQILNEMANVARRKEQLGWGEVHALLGALRDLLKVRALTLAVHETGLAVAERRALPIYDALIVASALDAGCETLWSEDVQHGLLVEGRLCIQDPFQPVS